MVKTFTIKEYNFKQVSQSKGAIEYVLVDEFGGKRTVTAVAKIGWNKKISSVKPVFKRETPLVQALVNRAVNDQVIVDFTGFNKNHLRVITTRTSAINRDFSKAKTQSHHHLKSDSMVVDKFRLAQFLFISALAVFVIIFLKTFS